MIFSKAIRIAAPLTGMAAALVLAAPAAAVPSNPFGCRASVEALRLIAPVPAAEPYVANPAETPCATDSAGADQSSTASPAGGSASAGPSAAYTASDTATPAATALASVDGGVVNGGGNTIALTGPSQAQAAYACVNGATAPTGSSDVTGAVIDGQTVRPSSPGAETTTQLGGGSYATINQQVQTPTSLTERAVFMHIEGMGDYVLGEAQVTRPASDPCVGGTGGAGGSGSGSGGSGSGGGGSGSGSGGSGSGSSGSGSGGSGDGAPSACPTGSVLVASAQMCEIVTAGGSEAIEVSRPFAGPTGGSVMSLAAARAKYKSSCLSGTGPKFVVVGTNKADRITSGKTAARILVLAGNDTVTVKNAASCVDGGNGADRITAGNGRDRLFGGAGNDVVKAGRGIDRITGGAGNDRITAGAGNDWVWGNAGKDTITAGSGKDHLFGGAGSDRLRAAGRHNWVNGGPGKDVASVAAKEMKYAHRHGCEKVRKIRATH
jgi:Ca2+-binding RTX toxin-like protein